MVEDDKKDKLSTVFDAEFIKQAKQDGYSDDEIKKMTSFSDDKIKEFVNKLWR